MTSCNTIYTSNDFTDAVYPNQKLSCEQMLIHLQKTEKLPDSIRPKLTDISITRQFENNTSLRFHFSSIDPATYRRILTCLLKNQNQDECRKCDNLFSAPK